MIWLALLGLALAPFGILVMRSAGLDNDGLAITGLLVLIGGFLLAFVMLVGIAGRHYDRVSCEQWGRQTERPARFVNLSAFQWTCLTRDNHGRWIPRDQLRSLK